MRWWWCWCLDHYRLRCWCSAPITASSLLAAGGASAPPPPVHVDQLVTLLDLD
ncbi:hypothetical protein PF005_g2570 [Phytophthora fragariae]|uniref:Uncharacterized protein n=1 Tax=Phytophthora fragariae TaxID=53985 RepID=A0A6A4DM41_9STRA|nr:hypothetical protein PF003_g34923 [Phytophthora fragariae]KAE8936667.1 hypothetical protein PF009_g13416 [Phytophthora fragariae]KAE9007385.1 hypothetical protein PF011_g11146 [Phytophthora fragariae]KAE9111895.1 hypothetical protein PF007_g11305 [Phytophthora fragariae]KAE9143817.1 hypothetical protein PF006_g11187 [Phytophthora fragariae]